ncbi:COG1470 family protein [[Eubacterium] cellulosolvens]
MNILCNSALAYDDNTHNDGGTSSRDSILSWSAMGLWTDSEELFAVAVGDVDATHPGEEIVVGGNSNKVTVVYGFGNSWVIETAFVDSWYITSIAIGDVYPHHPGNEIVLVGWSTYVTLVYKSTDTNKWVSERLYHDYDWLYDVTIGDLDPTHLGNEIISVGDPRHVMMIYFSEDTDKWENKIIWNNTPDINVVAIGNFDSSHKGNELAVTGVNVNELGLREIYYNYSTKKWSVKIIGEVEKDPLEMVIGDFYSGHDGDELALVSIQRHVLMIHEGEGQNEWVMEKLWQDLDSIRDIELADIIPEHPGDELILAGYSDSATVLMEDLENIGNWKTSAIYTSDTNLNGIAAGEFDVFHTGLELAVLQSKGKLLRVMQEVDGFNLFTPQPRYHIPAGNSISVPVVVSAEGAFSEQVNLEIDNAQELAKVGISPHFNLTHPKPPTRVELQLTIAQATAPGDYEVVISGEAPNVQNKVQLNFTLEVLSPDKGSFNISVLPNTASVVADFSENFGVEINKFNDWKDSVVLNIRYLPTGMAYSIAYPIDYPPYPLLTITTTSATPHERFFIIITGAAKQNLSFQYSTVLVLDVLPPEPTFELVVQPQEMKLQINGSAKFKIYGFSYFGFNEPITFNFTGLPGGVTANLEPESFTPTGNTTIVLTSSKKTELRRYNVTVVGTSTDSKTQRTAFFHIILVPEAPGFNVDLQPMGRLRVYEKETAVVKLNITPTAGFIGVINITILGLDEDMTWNTEPLPISISEESTVYVNVSGLNTPGEFDLTIIVSSENITKEQELALEILPEITSDDGGDGDGNIITIVIIIIILIIILIFVSKLTKRPGTKPTTKSDDEDEFQTITEVDKKND